MIKLTDKEIFKSAVTYLFGLVFLLAIFVALVALKGAEGFKEYFSTNYKQAITVFMSFIILTVLLYFFFFYEDKQYLKTTGKCVQLFIVLYIQIIASCLIGKYVNIIARPVAFLALMCTMLFKSRNAVFINIVYSIMMLILDRFSNLMELELSYIYANFLVTFCSGLIAIFMSRNIKTRISAVVIAPVVYVPTVLVYAIICNSFVGLTPSRIIELLIFGAINATLSIMMFMFILPIIERVFAERTVFLFRELTSDNAKLIKRLKEKAPGTYNHSVVVSQLVEACARAIGEDAELARAAAYYHDVGKLKNPEMFTENQTDYNYHSELPPELSVDIIRSHATDGEKLIKKSRLPEFFADVAVQHHGTLPVKYFYFKALNLSDGGLNIEQYSYPGPIPKTRIAALIMICDAAEAAARSLNERTAKSVEGLVRGIIEERLDMGQFDDCNITMRELTIVRGTIVSQLTGVYHSRVAYPKLSVSKKR